MRIFTLLLFAVLLLVELLSPVNADESPGFFLKITKNVPRLGKRTDGAVLKNMKTIPRMGRSDAQSSVSQLLAWMWKTDMDLDQPLLNKRRLPSNEGSAEQELNVVQPVNANTLLELLDRNAIPTEHVKFVHWKDFDRALQLDTELYAKVIHLGRNADQRLKQDLNFNSYIPIFAPGDGQGSDYMLYSKDDRDLYGGSSNFDRNYMHYNRL